MRKSLKVDSRRPDPVQGGLVLFLTVLVGLLWWVDRTRQYTDGYEACREEAIRLQKEAKDEYRDHWRRFMTGHMVATPEGVFDERIDRAGIRQPKR